MLKHLTKVTLSDKPQLSYDELLQCIVVFHFEDNPHFTNKSLKLSLQYLDGSPYRIVSDTIDWCAGKDLTKEEQVTTVKKGKNKGKEKTVMADKPSFFRIFSNCDGPSQEDYYSEKSEEEQDDLYRFEDVTAYIQLLWYDFSKYNAPTYYGVSIPNYAIYLEALGGEHEGLPEGADNEEDWSDEDNPKSKSPAAGAGSGH